MEVVVRLALSLLLLALVVVEVVRLVQVQRLEQVPLSVVLLNQMQSQG